MPKRTQRGVLISFGNGALKIITAVLLVPMLISALSEETYSLYKVIQSFAGTLMMFNLGVANMAAQAVSFCGRDGVRKKENTLALTVLVALLMDALVLLLGQGMKALLPTLFGNTFAPDQLAVAGKLVTIFSIATALHILSDCFRGRILGRERYVASQCSMTLFYILRFAAMAVIARTTADLCALALVDLVLYGGMAVLHILYSRCVLKETGKLTSVRRADLSPLAAYASAILLQALVTQAAGNMDAVILGAVNASPRTITMYVSALTIFTVYQSLTGSLSGLYLPRATQLTSQGADNRSLTDFVIGPGRIQAVTALGILFGFALLGRDFIRLWIGPEYLEAWPLALALMAAGIIPLTQTTCVTLLDSLLDRLPRSLVLLCMAVVNAVLSVLLVKPLGCWGPALGTIVSLLLGDGLLMSLYYKKRLGLEIGRMFRQIYSGILLGAVFSTLVCLPLALFEARSFSSLLVKLLLFLTAYLTAIWQVSGYKKKGAPHGPQ